MRPGGEQALANVLHVAELARQYEARGAVSFRGFVEELIQAAEAGKQSEAMISGRGIRGRTHDERAQGERARIPDRPSSPTLPAHGSRRSRPVR